VDEIKAAAPALGMQLRFLGVSEANAFERELEIVAKDPPDALATCWDSMTLALARPIAEFALRRRLPTVSPLKEYVEAGGLISLGTSLSAQRRRTAYYVDKILKGAKPADLPVERPTQFDLVVNLATAKALGVTLPPTVVLFADEVIQ
jgi:putative tryptophan/tyrosine transport system substrate-binding protein